MKINGVHYQTIWEKESDPGMIQILDQRLLPFELKIADLRDPEQYAFAIREMQVRGAPLIGVTAAYGMYAATLQIAGKRDPEKFLGEIAGMLKNTRPTAVDLFYAVDLCLNSILQKSSPDERVDTALSMARKLKAESIESCRKIGEHGLELIRNLKEKKDGPVNILTHCNAGWLACIDYGTATAPVYLAFDQGIPVHVWVDETRPRNQGAKLTAYELSEHGVPHTVIPDNAGGHLMQHGQVDLVIVGTDRTTRAGDVANKIGTYLKALAARDNQVPFYVALPSSSIDWSIRDGIRDIRIETRDEKEVTHMEGWDGEKITEIRVTPFKSQALNHGFDVTPANLVTGLITEKGICEASERGLTALFRDKISSR
ncbi:MAG: S-methyl-5-thioribose-1-phosphate isomerase [Cyclobacteriaceae bacterium]|nr:S-methyl-5-thioribose-1-phosphate isomerase [Cyclobacteriaceae bacterium]